MRFAEGLGVDRGAVRNAALLETTRESVAEMMRLTRSEEFRVGLAALYAYESQVPAVAKTKREGLAKFYSIDAPRAVEFFTVHEEADVVHSRIERDLLAEHCPTEEEQTRACLAADEASRALWHFLDGVYSAYCPEAREAR
jgi:pyrroloquinoline-quinone synthase